MQQDNDRIPLTSDGLRELKEEYDRLVKTTRPEVVRRLSKARDEGDLSENSSYLQSKEELSFIDGRIAELEEVINRAVVVNQGNGKCRIVSLGCKVTIKMGNQKDSSVFHLVGEWEADPASLKISHQSPLGRALLGKKVGDNVEVEAPVGKLVYKIVRID